MLDLIFDNPIPSFLYGVSSGGWFAGQLVHSSDLKIKISALCVQISYVQYHMVKPPPILFITMANDFETLRYIEKYDQQQTVSCLPQWRHTSFNGWVFTCVHKFK